MRRPLADKRPIGPFVSNQQLGERMAEVRHGPIWTWVEVTTYNGSREDSPLVTRDHVDFVDHELKDVFTSQPVQDRLVFAGDLEEFDVFTSKASDLTVSTFVRHSEDFISIRLLDEVIETIQDRVNSHKDLTVRDYRVVSEEFVEQREPAIV